jgi:hypothetical protein
MLWNREPVMWMLVIESLVYGVTEFGFDVSSGQQVAILGIAAALLSLITRAKVTPTDNGGV